MNVFHVHFYSEVPPICRPKGVSIHKDVLHSYEESKYFHFPIRKFTPRKGTKLLRLDMQRIIINSSAILSFIFRAEKEQSPNL